ncbi:MAG TPA: BamA/TamA family outer membrane protein [Flavobacteriales bacterium]
MILLAVVLSLSACSSTKRVPEGHYLLTRTPIVSDAADLSNSELLSIVKQKPNKRVLGVPLYLYLYNMADPVKTARKKNLSDSLCAVENIEREKRVAERNIKREARGKKPKEFSPKECPKTRRVWWREDVGEAPVLLDSALTHRTLAQLELYLLKEGYFEAEVSDTIMLSRNITVDAQGDTTVRNPKAVVEYRIKAGYPYTLCTWNWRVNDPRMDSLMTANKEASLLKAGMRFDSDVLDLERTRITTLMRQQGYLFFTRDLVIYDADTAAGDHEIDLLMRLEHPMARAERGLRGTPEGTVYRIEDIRVDISGKPTQTAVAPVDTLQYNGSWLFYRGKHPIYRPRALFNQVRLRSGTTYSQTTMDRTYRRLNNLRIFDRVDITFDTLNTAAKDLADVRINLLPSKRQNFSTEGFGTNRGGFLGTAVSFSYRHKNLLRSLGSISTQMTLGFEAQQSFSDRSNTDVANTDVSRGVLFNTLEFGPEVTLRFPRFLLPIPFVDPDSWVKSWNQRTTVTALYNYQRRPDYTRSLAKISFGYEWNKGRTRTFGLFPVDFNLIRIPTLSDAFLDFIRTSNDAVLRDSYTDHVITGARASYTWNTQQAGTTQRNLFYWRPSIQTSGHLMRLLNRMTDQAQETDTAGNSYYTMAGVRFAQFVKVEQDFRYYRTIHSRSSMVFRAAAGVGVPFGNLDVLPFESSFFGGGANGMRAWRARSLGPGSYRAPLLAFDRIGEIRMEGNAEYRFKLIGYVEGALFADVGNIWMLKENPAKPGSGFEWQDFYSELAVGTGLGLRLNFDFFLVRFDLGLQTKDPALRPGERWIFQPKDRFAEDFAANGVEATYRPQFNFNLGIGYPF